MERKSLPPLAIMKRQSAIAGHSPPSRVDKRPSARHTRARRPVGRSNTGVLPAGRIVSATALAMLMLYLGGVHTICVNHAFVQPLKTVHLRGVLRHGVGGVASRGRRTAMLPLTMQTALSPSLEGPILVTGASGRTGRIVVKELLGRGQKVRAMLRDVGGAEAGRLAGMGAEVVCGDVCKFKQVVDSMEGCSACIACHGSERPSKPLKDVAYKLWDPLSVFLGIRHVWACNSTAPPCIP